MIQERPTVVGVDTESALAASYQTIASASGGQASVVTVSGEPALYVPSNRSTDGNTHLSLMVGGVYIDMVSSNLTGSELQAAATDLGPLPRPSG